MDDKLEVGLRLTDIFQTQKYQFNLNDINYTEALDRGFDSRNLYLTFTWKFGTDGNKKKNPSKKQNDNQNGPDNMGF
jgi:hypothetical protein